ncbi:hypothetical protein [Streptosporangium sp. NPDC023615]|uniref:hypothetical protein n=1 Tax=Streptosporangium sp. NPDC023615 TaxID=3154794 RepID=UPI0034396E2B
MRRWVTLLAVVLAGSVLPMPAAETAGAATDSGAATGSGTVTGADAGSVSGSVSGSGSGSGSGTAEVPGRAAGARTAFTRLAGFTGSSGLVAVPRFTGFPATATSPAAAVSPVTALRRQFGEHVGLRISDLGRVYRAGKPMVTIWRRGRVEFDATGVYGTDTTGRTELGRGAVKEMENLLGRRLGSTRVICFPDEAYLSGPGYETWLPEGKTWLGLIGPANIKQTAALPQIVDIFEPSTLGTLLSHTAVRRKLRSGTYLRGTVTLRTLYRASPSLRDRLAGPPRGRSATTPVGFRLWLDRSNLVRRLSTTWRQPLPGGPQKYTTTLVDTRYTGWGSSVTLAPPPPEDTADAGRVGADIPPPAVLPIG